jgi:hypothetical protein
MISLGSTPRWREFFSACNAAVKWLGPANSAWARGVVHGVHGGARATPCSAITTDCSGAWGDALGPREATRNQRFSVVSRHALVRISWRRYRAPCGPDYSDCSNGQCAALPFPMGVASVAGRMALATAEYAGGSCGIVRAALYCIPRGSQIGRGEDAFQHNPRTAASPLPAGAVRWWTFVAEGLTGTGFIEADYPLLVICARERTFRVAAAGD